jgi:hypothetical protein
MAATISLLGSAPVSESLLAFTRIMNRIVEFSSVVEM